MTEKNEKVIPASEWTEGTSAIIHPEKGINFRRLKDAFTTIHYEGGYNKIARLITEFYNIDHAVLLSYEELFSMIGELNKRRSSAKDAVLKLEELLGEPMTKEINKRIEDACRGYVGDLFTKADPTSTPIEVAISGGIFIIPNGPITMEKLNFGKKRIERIIELNQLTLNEDSFLIQVWSFDPNDDDSNFQDHYIKGLPQYKIMRSSCKAVPRLPYELLKELKEGEVLRFKEEVLMENWERDGKMAIPIIINWELTASQLTTRYRRFGKFEEVLADVINR